MAETDPHQRADDAWDRRAWAQARDAFLTADRAELLRPEDLQRLAVASYLSGDDTGSVAAWARAFQALQRGGDLPAAARCAFWQAFQLFIGGEPVRAGGWLTRARRLLDECGRDCAEHGLVQALTAIQLLEAGDPAGAQAGFADAVRTGQRFGDRDVEALGRLGQGQSLVALGQSAEGMGLLDELMVAVTADEVSPVVAGLAYCAVIGTCRELFDLRRAAEWTTALSVWCGGQPELVAYRGQCLIHRSELLQALGDWPEAMREAATARQQLSEPTTRPALGWAYHQQAELHRLRGDFGAAENAYREAVRWGNPPQPGFALLRLSQGRVDAAQTIITRLLSETSEVSERCRLLPARVEISLAASDLSGARSSAAELTRLSVEVGAPYLRALAAHATGAVLLAEGDPAAARAQLMQACETWQELDVPYEGARTRVLLALAYGDLGDPDSAGLQLDAATAVLTQIGAAVDLARIARRKPLAGGLTDRELEVLRLVAGGQTNRAIAECLVISEKTVARHVSNIFTKLGLASRTAAAAYAYEHRLV